MKTKNILLMSILILSILPSVMAENIHYSDTEIVADIYLDKNTIPEDFYTFMTWNLGDVFNDDSIDVYNLDADLSFVNVGGILSPTVSVCLIPNQGINLLTDSVSQIYTEETTECLEYTINTASGERFYIDVSELLQELLINDKSADSFTFRIEDTSRNTVIPNERLDVVELKVGSNLDEFVLLASSTYPTSAYRPYLDVIYQEVDPMNILVQPNEFRWLTQVESNKSLDNNGLERTLLRCIWNIDGIGEEFVDMDSNFCPGEKQNYTFTGSEDYTVQIVYLDIFYNVETGEWEQSGEGISGNLHNHYNLVLSEPEDIWLQGLWDSIWDSISGALCDLFPWLGFCE